MYIKDTHVCVRQTYKHNMEKPKLKDKQKWMMMMTVGGVYYKNTKHVLYSWYGYGY